MEAKTLPEKDWVTTTKAAELLQVSPTTVNKWCHAYDDSFAKRIGGRFRVQKDAIYKILQTGDMPPLRDTSATQAEAVADDDNQRQLFEQQ